MKLFKIKLIGRIALILFLFYAVSIFVLSVLPINGKYSHINHVYLINIRLDYVVHAAIFLPWMLLYTLAVKGLVTGQRWKILLTGLLSGLLFAAVTEGVQYIVPYRSFNVNDLIGNVIGVVLGAALETLNPEP
jgi:VanZ family protein